MTGCALLLVGLALCGSAAAQPDPFRVQSVTLKNGLLVLIVPDSQATAVDVGVWYRAGTRYEKPAETGITNLVGRMMFGGSKRFPAGEHRRLLEAEGGVVNTVTNPDYSCFYETVPVEALGLALRLEADRMANLTITESGFDRARREARAEGARRLASPLARGLQALYASVFAGHPYSRPVVGLPRDLDRVTAKTAAAYYGQRFSPAQAVLTIVGRVDPATTLARVREAFEAIPRRASSAAPLARLPKPGAERRDWVMGGQGPSVLLVGWIGPGGGDPDGATFDVLAQILILGANARVKTLAAGDSSAFLEVQGDLDRGREASLLFCVAVTRPGVDSVSAEGALTEAVERLARDSVSDDDLDRARRQIESRTLFAWQTVRGRAEALGLGQLVDLNPRAALDRLQRIRQVTPLDVQRVAARYLKPEGRSTVWVSSPGAEGSGVEGGVHD